MGKEEAQKVFDFIQSGLLEHDKDSAFTEFWKQEIGTDITSYEDVDRLKPTVVLNMIHFLSIYSLFDEQEEKTELLAQTKKGFMTGSFTEDGEYDCSSLDSELMDNYLEKSIFCKGKPVHNIETMEGVVSDVLGSNHYDEAERLSLTVDQLIFERAIPESPLSGMDTIFSEWEQLMLQVEGILLYETMNSYHQGTKMDMSLVPEISSFLTERQCSSLPESFINQYEEQLILFPKLFIEYILSGKQVNQETEQKFSQLMRKANALKIDIFSFCFPDYTLPENLEETMKRQERLVFLNLKQIMENLIVSRDKKQALRLIPFLEEGGAFAAVGFAHLSGVIEELRAQGWELKSVKLSRPLERSYCSGPAPDDIDSLRDEREPLFPWSDF